jgi:hypothetical protein
MAHTCPAFWWMLFHISQAAVGYECHHRMSCPSPKLEPDHCPFPTAARPPDTASVNMQLDMKNSTAKCKFEFSTKKITEIVDMFNTAPISK